MRLALLRFWWAMSELLEPGHVRGDIKLVTTQLLRGVDVPEVVLTNLMKRLGHIIAKGSDADAIKAGALVVKVVERNDAVANPIQQHQHAHAHAVIPATSETALDAIKREGFARLARLGQG